MQHYFAKFQDCSCRQFKRAGRERQRDARTPVTLMQALYELVLNRYPRSEISRAEPDREVDAGIAKRVVAQARLKTTGCSVRVYHQLACHLKRDLFDLVKRAAVIHADVDGDGEFI